MHIVINVAYAVSLEYYLLMIPQEMMEILGLMLTKRTLHCLQRMILLIKLSFLTMNVSLLGLNVVHLISLGTGLISMFALKKAYKFEPSP